LERRPLAIPQDRPKLVIFDVEGVLIPKNRFFYLLGKSLGFTQLVKVFFFGFLYETGLLPLKTVLKSLFKCTQDMKVDTMMHIADRVPTILGAETLVTRLKAQGYKVVLITSGLPTMIVKMFADKLGVDMAYGFDVGMNGYTLTGEIWGDVIEKNGKLSVLQRLFKERCLEPNDCIVVADDRNNISIFLPEALKIAVNPDFWLRIRADRVVLGGLERVLAAINGEPKHRGNPSHRDILRELLHAFGGFFVPVAAFLVGVPIVAAFIVVVLSLYAVSEYLRTEGIRMPLINRITRNAASENELYQVVLAPIYFALGILLTLLVFPYPANAAAIAMFALGDSAASIFGRNFARTSLPFNKDKSLEGSFAGFIFAFLAGLVFISPLYAAAGALIAIFIEYLPLPINDNLLIPLVTGLALTLLL
jgi:dolichol kinase/phosphoserine phosphatase